MKAVILAGGRGTRISEESDIRPKPMIMIGGMPILWHIMKHYSSYGIEEFIICLGYKGYMIKEYFSNFLLHSADVVEIDLGKRTETYSHTKLNSWNIRLVETGEETQTGGRLKRIEPWVKDDEAFCLTYGDGLSDVDVAATVTHHRNEGKLATVTAVTPPGRFGALEIDGSTVTQFAEKPVSHQGAINGGYFVLSPKVLEYIKDDSTVWEHEPLQMLAESRQLTAYRHDGFWQAMDTKREHLILEKLWASGSAPWAKDRS